MLESKGLAESETTAEIPHILDERPRTGRAQVMCPARVEDVLPLYAVLLRSGAITVKARIGEDLPGVMTLEEQKRRHCGVDVSKSVLKLVDATSLWVSIKYSGDQML